MKNYFRAVLVSLAVLAAPLGVAQTFSPEIRITTIAAISAQPDIAAVGNNVYLVWNEALGGIGEVFFARSTNGGANFSAPVNLTNTPGVNDTLAVMGVSADGLQVHIMWTDEYNVGSILYRRSIDGGATFLPVATLVDNGPSFYARPSSVLVDSNNCVHVAWYDNRTVGYGQVFHKMSCDAGVNWSVETEVSFPDGAVDNETPKMVEINKTIFMQVRTSRNGLPQGGWPPFDQYMYRGTIPASAPVIPPGGADAVTWQRPAQKVSRGLPDEISNTYAGGLVTGANSALHTAFWAEKTGNNLFYRAGFPNGKGFGPVVNLSGFGLNHPEFDGNTFERLGWGLGEDNSQRVHVVFGANETVFQGFQVGSIYYRCSPDQGVTWMPRTMASNRATQAATVRAAWSTAANKFHIVWQDYRDNNSGSEIYYKNLTPGPCIDPNADSDNDGIPNGVEALEGRNVAVKDNDIFTASNLGSRLFAMQQYRDFLGREGDAAGVDYYTNQLNGNANLRANIIESFFSSPEFQLTTSPIVRLYFAFFNRYPDYAGLIFQVNAYKSGTPLAVIANNFAASPEFIATYGSLNNTQYVQLLYQNVLGRAASQPEIDYHVNRLNMGATRGEVMLGFSESPEYINLKANSVYVTMMYVGMLRREPDQAGFDFWVNYMNSNPGIALIAGFLNAPEYHNRFL